MKTTMYRLAPRFIFVTGIALILGFGPARAADDVIATNSATPEVQVSVAVPSSLQLPSVFGDNMVLQQNQRVPVWGWSRPGTDVTVKFGGQTRHSRAGDDGRWEVRLNSLKASSQPADLVIEAGETRTLSVTTKA